MQLVGLCSGSRLKSDEDILVGFGGLETGRHQSLSAAEFSTQYQNGSTFLAIEYKRVGKYRSWLT